MACGNLHSAIDYHSDRGGQGTLLLGEGVPGVELGVDGDFYLNCLTFDFYQKVGGVWV